MTIEINPGFTETPIYRDSRQDSKEFRRYRMKWNDYPNYDIVDYVPIHLDIETSARCQLKCPGCPSMKLDFDKGDIDFGMASAAIREFASQGGSSVKLNWRGEPTLYRYLPDLVHVARDNGLVDIMLNTNGLALTPALSRLLVDMGLTTMIFSIDSFDPERYRLLRPGSELDRVLKNLRSFLEIIKEPPLNIRVYCRVQRIAYPDEPVSHDDFVNYFREKFPRVNAVASNHYKVKELAGDQSVASKPCAQLWQRLVMTYEGWLGPCCEFNRFGEHRFGKFPEASIYNVWRGLEIERLRDMHKTGRQNEVAACRACTVTKPMVRC